MHVLSPITAFLDGLGGGELFAVLLLALMLFGGEKLPGLARSMGKMMAEFRRARDGVQREIQRAIDEKPETPVKPYQPYGDGPTVPVAPTPAAAPEEDAAAKPPPPPAA